MREKNYTPSERLEAEDKSKGQEQAKFYRCFLDKFRTEILNLSSEKNSELKLNELDDKELEKISYTLDILLGDLERDALNGGDGSYNINICVDKAAKEAGELTGVKERPNINLKELGGMTLTQFNQHIDQLKSSLIKE